MEKVEGGYFDETTGRHVPQETIDSFDGDRARSLLFTDRYALRNREGHLLERTWEESSKRVAGVVGSVW